MTDGTLIVIPAFNEEGHIASVLESIQLAAPDLPVLVVDDGSADGTAGRARKAGARVVSHPFNLGYGAALQTGYRYALARGYARVVQMDADGQHEASFIRSIVPALEEGFDLVLGSRFLHAQSYRPPLARRLGIALFSAAASWAAGWRITDATTGFQGLSRRLIRFYDSQGRFPHDCPDANMIIRAARAGFRIRELPVRMRAGRPGGGMYAGLRPLRYILKMSLGIAVEFSRRLPLVEE